jgi:hypothetical protein
MKRKWFSFNQKTGKVEEIQASEEIFNSSPDLLFWTRSMESWVDGATALGFFNANPEKPLS